MYLTIGQLAERSGVATSALRFYYEYGPSELQGAITRSLLPLVDRPEFAAAAIIDLARWQRWEALDRIVAVYSKAQSDGPTRRAVVAFLAVCPKPEADAALEQLRKADPDRIRAIEKSLLVPGDK